MARGRPTAFTREEVEFIARHWRDMTDEQLAEKLGKTPDSVKKFRQRVGLVVKRLTTAEVREVIAQVEAEMAQEERRQ